jgi:hypothetical protein
LRVPIRHVRALSAAAESAGAIWSSAAAISYFPCAAGTKSAASEIHPASANAFVWRRSRTTAPPGSRACSVPRTEPGPAGTR